MALSDVQTVQSYNSFLQKGLVQCEGFPRVYELTKNLCYSFTFLEYLDRQINAEENYVVKCQLIKSYILTGMSIVEGVLFYFIKSSNLLKKTSYEVANTYLSNEQSVNGETIKVETKLLRKLQHPVATDMNLDSMIKKAESKNLLELPADFYKKLNHFRKLRNAVHIQTASNLNHDFNAFKTHDYSIMKEVLLNLCESKKFKSSEDKISTLFYFLKS